MRNSGLIISYMLNPSRYRTPVDTVKVSLSTTHRPFNLVDAVTVTTEFGYTVKHNEPPRPEGLATHDA